MITGHVEKFIVIKTYNTDGTSIGTDMSFFGWYDSRISLSSEDAARRDFGSPFESLNHELSEVRNLPGINIVISSIGGNPAKSIEIEWEVFLLPL